MARKNKMGAGHIIRSNTKRKASGKRAYKNGLTLEKSVEAYSQFHIDEYGLDKSTFKAEIYRNHDAMQKARGRGGNLTAFTTGISPCDFTFFCSAEHFEYIFGGMIEAKSRAKHMINKSAISEHQKQQLIRMSRLGQLGLILVMLTDNEDSQFYFLVPIQNWFRGRKKSHNVKDLKAIGYELSTCKITDDNLKEWDCPDIIEGLERIEADFKQHGDFFPVPDEYREQFDNKKLKNPIYSTIDQDLDDDLDVDL